jgi:hypothetical protein
LSATSLPQLAPDLALPAFCRAEGSLSTFNSELLPPFPSIFPLSCLSTFNFELLTPFLSTDPSSNLRTFQRCPSPNSFALTPLCNPFRLTPYPSHSYKNSGGHPSPISIFSFHFPIQEGFSQDCRIQDSYFSSQSIGSRQTASMSDIGREQGWAGRCPSSRRRPLAPAERVSFTIGARVLKF